MSEYNALAQQHQQSHHESHLFQPTHNSGGNVANLVPPIPDHSSSMENNSLNISMGSIDGSHYDGHQTPQQLPCQDSSSMATSTPTSGSAGSAEYYSPSSANACASGSGYDSEKHAELCEEQMPAGLVPGGGSGAGSIGGGSCSSSSSSHKSDKKDKRERDEAKELAKKEKKATKKLIKELSPCKTVLEEMEVSLFVCLS